MHNPTDTRLIECYMAVGLFASREDAVFSLDDVVRIVRAAYWFGVRDYATDPAGVAEAEREYLRRMAAISPISSA
jgi:hypothetical protein